MASDISRTSDEQRYQGVVMQQGRVILDRDFNALRQTIDRRIEADALDLVGPCGTPDNGFEIGPVAARQAQSTALDSAGAAKSARFQRRRFFNLPRHHVRRRTTGLFPSKVPGQGAVDYSYFDQPDWISPDLPSAYPTCEFIYLHLLEHDVSAVEDPELKDVALGGPDTTQRLRLVKRVKRLAVTSAIAHAALAQAVSQWQQKGLAFDPQTMRLIPQATMQVSYSQPTTQTDPCDPVAQGGYLGADNQLIRVQITDGGVPGAPPQLLWGSDNASSLYRAKVSTNSATQTSTALVLGQSPVDAFHIPQIGQVVEVLRCALIIASEPDETNPQQPATIVRCVAEARGITCTLTAPYQPDTRTLSLDQALPPEYLNDTNPLFVRIWQSQIPFIPDGHLVSIDLRERKLDWGAGDNWRSVNRRRTAPVPADRRLLDDRGATKHASGGLSRAVPRQPPAAGWPKAMGLSAGNHRLDEPEFTAEQPGLFQSSVLQLQEYFLQPC